MQRRKKEETNATAMAYGTHEAMMMMIARPNERMGHACIIHGHSHTRIDTHTRHTHATRDMNT